jgi:hypothetical protein
MDEKIEKYILDIILLPLPEKYKLAELKPLVLVHLHVEVSI